MRADGALVAGAAEANRGYWIAAVALACALVALVGAGLAFVLVRGCKKTRDAAVGSPSATLVDTATQKSRPGSVVKKLAAVATTASPVDHFSISARVRQCPPCRSFRSGRVTMFKSRQKRPRIVALKRRSNKNACGAAVP